MNPKHQFVIFMAALGTLLAGAAQGNTPVAKLPLKASALALPNVILGMDDSGSMDWEPLLNTSSGVIWWNGSNGWDNVANTPQASHATLWPYAYLFPVGTATGGSIYPADGFFSQAAPPIAQLAWVRSSAFNPGYYNPLVTYRPWRAAYVDGAFRASYPNANPAAAPSHPAVAASPTLALGSPWTSANPNFTSAGWRFYVQEGMVLPAGTRVLSSDAGAGGLPCTGAVEVDLTAAQTVGAGSACWASIPYFPATYWHAEACTLGADCVAQPDGTGTLRRYEIRASTASYPSGRSYADELQNFANWFTYYRKRKLMLAAAMTEVLESTSGLRLGVMPFNVNETVKMVDADAPAAADNRYFAAGRFHLNAMVAAGTPTHQVMKNIAAQFEANTGDDSSNVVQYACQRNAMFLVTDGFSNTATSEVPPYDPTTYGATPPYAVTPAGSLSDLALAYYTRRLRGDLPAGRVPAGNPNALNPDLNTSLHINTYALTLGVRGTLWPDGPSAANPFAVPPTWPLPVGNTPLMIDDLWHATINGRGKMYLADSPEQTSANIRAGLQDILSGQGSQGGIAVDTVNLTRGNGFVYAASYNPAGWSGDLEAYPVNAVNGAIGATRSWSASERLATKPPASRVIVTWNGSAGAAFQAGTVGSIVNPANAWGANTTAVMSYLRGNRSGEGIDFRARTSLLGAVINAEPFIDREHGVAYLATGEGMLHAFDLRGAEAGNELWAYVPGPALAGMGEISARGYSFSTRLDATPVVRMTDSGVKLLVSGMGSAGRGYFALDVTQPRGQTESSLAGKVLWEFPTAAVDRPKVGQTLGKPAIVKLASGTSVVLVTSGYNSTADGKGRLFVLNAATGDLIKEYVTPEGALGAEAGLAQVSPMAEPDGSVRYVYGGDLLGNVWRFDLSLDPAAAGAVNRIAQLRDGMANPQPVTTAPELLSWQGQRIVMIGTGRLLAKSDFGSSRVHSVYAISDGAPLPNSARQNLVAKTIDVSGNGSITGADVDWKTQRGWYADLPPGEHINTRPVLAYGALAFVANKTGGSDCSASSRLYVIDALTGNKFAKADFVTAQVSATLNSSGLTTLLSEDGRLSWITRPTDGSIVNKPCEACGSVITPAKNSWREIRR